MDSPHRALIDAVAAAGGQAALARKIGRTQPTIWYWLNKLGQVPAEDAPAVELASGIPKHLLRPDIFDAPAGFEDAGGGDAGSAPAPAGATPPAEPVEPTAPAEVAGNSGGSDDAANSGRGAFDRFAGRTVQCALCERRLSETTVRACQAPDCPQSDREAA